MGGAQSFEVIQPVIGFAGHPLRPIVDVEQDRVVSRSSGPDQIADVTFVDAHARIGQAVAG